MTAYRAQVGDTEVVLRSISITPPYARVTLNGIEKAVTFVIAQRIHLSRGGQSYSLDDTTHAPAQRASARERRPPRRADERPRGRGPRQGGRHGARPGAR